MHDVSMLAGEWSPPSHCGSTWSRARPAPLTSGSTLVWHQTHRNESRAYTASLSERRIQLLLERPGRLLWS